MYPFPENRQRGFSLVELLVSMAIGLVILAALSTTFMVQRDTYSIQDQITEAVQTCRAAIDMMSREIRMAGYDPTSAGFDGITYDADEMRLLSDLDGDGSTSGSNEDITYRYFANSHEIKRQTGNGTFQPFADNIQAFTFEYLNSGGSATTATASIQQMRITIVVRTSRPDPDFPQNGGYRTTTLTTLVIPHNLGFPSGVPGTTTVSRTSTSTTTIAPTTSTTTSSVSTTSTTTSTSTTSTSTVPTTTTTSTTTTTTPPSATSTTTAPTTTSTSIEPTTTTTTSPTTTTSVPIDMSAPTIAGITQSPSGGSVPKNLSVDIAAEVTDANELASVVLHTSFETVVMALDSGDTYSGSIPKHNNQTIEYWIVAEDIFGNTATSGTNSYGQP